MWKQPVSISRDMDKEYVVCIYNGVFSAKKIKKKKRKFATTWMVLEEVMPSERSQTQNSKYYMFSLIGGI